MSASNHQSSKRHRHPPELRERAVRMVLETIKETGERHGVVTRVAVQRPTTSEVVRFINAPSRALGSRADLPGAGGRSIYLLRGQPTSARDRRDEELKVEIARVHKDNFSLYGVEKVWRQLKREGIGIGRDRVTRLMRDLNLAGVVRGKTRTTVAGVGERPGRPGRSPLHGVGTQPTMASTRPKSSAGEDRGARWSRSSPGRAGSRSSSFSSVA